MTSLGLDIDLDSDQGIFKFEFAQSLRKMLMDLMSHLLEDIHVMTTDYTIDSGELSFRESWLTLLDSVESWKVTQQKEEANIAIHKFPQVVSFYKAMVLQYAQLTMSVEVHPNYEVETVPFHEFLHAFYCGMIQRTEVRKGIFRQLTTFPKRFIVEEVLRKILIDWCSAQECYSVNAYPPPADIYDDDMWESASQMHESKSKPKSNMESNKVSEHVEKEKIENPDIRNITLSDDGADSGFGSDIDNGRHEEQKRNEENSQPKQRAKLATSFF